VFVTGEDRDHLLFAVQADEMWAIESKAEALAELDEDAGARRAYATTIVKRRLHQLTFRARVIRAYQTRCALCRLRHTELLDAAHITPDADPEGEPLISNGLALCKLHHAAFDRFFFTVRPDYTIEVRESILEESDGPMLIVGLQQIHGQRIFVPSAPAHQPDRLRLERRYEDFRQAS
jgi:putative restriction endonuclease